MENLHGNVQTSSETLGVVGGGNKEGPQTPQMEQH